MWRSFVGAITGAIIGIIVGFVIAFFGDFLSCACSLFGYNSGFESDTAVVITGIVGAVIGLIIGICYDVEAIRERRAEEKERRAEEERQRRAEEEQRRKNEQQRQERLKQEQERLKQEKFDNWKKKIYRKFQLVESLEQSGNMGEEYKAAWNDIWKEENQQDPAYKRVFESRLSKHRRELVENIYVYLDAGALGMTLALCDMICLWASYRTYKNGDVIEGDKRFDPAIENLKSFSKRANDINPCCLKMNDYGNFTLPLNELSKMNENAAAMLSNLQTMTSKYSENKTGSFEGIAKYMNAESITGMARLMWYYAQKKPFDVNQFQSACDLYGKYTSSAFSFIPAQYRNSRAAGDHTFRIGKVEEILAVIYSKNQIGGKGVVAQEKDYINAWIEAKVEKDSREELEIFCSGLAWMELYDLELETLRTMVRDKVQLSPILQERLHFLEVGGSANVQVYEVEKQKDFVFDSSSENWNADEFNAFFRKVGMKKLVLNYSLVISTWKKTLPLSGGQKASSDALNAEFQKIMQDFDGEVTCERTSARAVNLENVVYEDAFVFRFSSERNKGLTVMFSSEKFGRNLNLTILTLYTPDSGLDTEAMQKYAVAIKSNIYVDSFRETLLQAVDEVIREKKDIYESEEETQTKSFFE